MKQKDETKDKVRICFVGDLSLSFVKKDYEILEKYFTVDVAQPPKKRNLSWLKYVLVLARDVFQSDLSFSRFAGWHSAFAVFFARLFRKKSIVVSGGYDCAYVPEIGYGAFTNLKEKIPAVFVFRYVDKILPVHECLKRDILKHTSIPDNKIEVVYNAYNADYWEPSGRKENLVVTVGNMESTIIKRKGLETFVKAAKYVPNAKFVIVGRDSGRAAEHLKSIASENVGFTGYLPRKELIKWYQKAKVYCQLSLYEGFGNAPCEAMLCGCVPVGTKNGGIPTVIGDTGFYVPYGDERATAEAIKKALNAPDDLGEQARQRIKEMFPIGRRERQIVEAIENR